MEGDGKAENRMRLAVLIDGENAQPSLLEQMLDEVGKHGTITIRRIYGDWTTSQMSQWKELLHTHAVQPIQQFRYTAGKNSTDSALIIDAMDILHNGNVEGFCIISSDSDYTRLATRLREEGRFVIGIGKRTTPLSFVRGCNVFVFTQNLVSEESEAALSQRTPQEEGKETDTGYLKELLLRAYDLSVQEDGWAYLAQVGNLLSQLDPSFDPRTYGKKRLMDVLSSFNGLFEIKKIGQAGNPSVYVVRKKGDDQF